MLCGSGSAGIRPLEQKPTLSMVLIDFRDATFRTENAA
jgi:hypothetical protein